MRYYVELDGQESQDVETQRYALEVHADHQQEAKAIAIVRAKAGGLSVDIDSVQISSR